MERDPQALKALFDPKTIAIIGASNDVRKFGGRPIRYMLEAGYNGTIYPINPRDAEVQGLKAYKDVRDVPEIVDMAVVSIPAPGVVDQVRACAEAGVRSVVIFSSGFAEVGDDADGQRWQRELVEIAQSSNTRLVGPNCMGILNTKIWSIGTFASAFEHGWPRHGGVVIASQSGAVGSHMMVLARERGLGIHGFVTTGNECDVDVSECLAYLAADDDTTVIAAYLEGCQKPDLLIAALETARRNRKPVVMMKVGASEIGAGAASTHTASLAGADDVFDAVFRQYGAHRVHSLEEMMDVSAACAAGAYPDGRNLGIVTVSGGVGVICSDTAVRYGLDVPELPQKAQAELKALMPFAAVRNPVDTTAQMLNDMNLLKRNTEVLLDHGNCDAILIFLTSIGFSPTMMPPLREILREIREQYPDRLIVGSMMLKPEDQELFEQLRYMNFEDPCRAIAVIAALAAINEGFNRPVADAPPALPAGARTAPLEMLNEVDTTALLRDAGVPTVDNRLATSRDDAVAAAVAVGLPVVMKIVSADIQHKSDVGGVRLGLANADAVAAAYDDIMAAVAEKAPTAGIDGVLIAPMVAGGVETILGTHTDPVFGPVVLFGLGGIFVEVLKDVTFRVAPFGIDEAHRMIREVKGYPMLEGVRGQPPADVDALAEALARLSVYAAAERDRIESIDLNPFLVLPKGQGALAVDALVAPKAP